MNDEAIPGDAGDARKAGEAGDAPGTPAAAVRGPELGAAAVLMVIAAFAIADSLRVGIGWADDGPRAGYFPFYIGLLLFGASAWTFATTLRRWRALGAPFAMRHELAGVWAVLWPSVVFVAMIPFAGIYVAAALLIGFFMRRHGHYAWPVVAAVAVAVPLVFFGVFERWFLVPLPKGPLEAVLGF